jgi:hypothetical protein
MSHLLFSYGTLQLERVQLSLFGRRLEGDADVLTGYAEEVVIITDPAVIAASGFAEHRGLVPSDDPVAAIPGMAFVLTPAELDAADVYEGTNYRRTPARLASGREAWVYVKI